MARRTADGIRIISRALAREARLLGRVGAPGDADAAKQFERALRSPERVRAFLGLPEPKQEREPADAAVGAV